MMLLVLVCAQNFTWSPWSLSSELFYPHCQEILESEFIGRSRKFLPLGEHQDCHNQAAGHISPGKGQDPLPGWNVKSQTIPQFVGIKDPLVPRIDHETQRKF
jgi:hypothetical protein